MWHTLNGVLTLYPMKLHIERKLMDRGPRAADLTSFVGRGQELADLRALFPEHRLITLFGPAGVGKTRLAERYLDVVGGGIVLSLGELRSGDAIWHSLGVALGLERAARARWARRLEGRLLLLDNCEHLIDAASAAAAELCALSSTVRVLATSRELLRIGGEYAFELKPLALPSSPQELETSDAARLFVDRMRSVRGDLPLDGANAEAVAAIVSRLDGLPLAIELAAARTNVLSLSALAKRLEEPLATLTGGGRSAERSLRGALGGSWDLLGEAERATLAQCSVFRGGFDVTAAEGVVELGPEHRDRTLLDLLASLRDKSLLRVMTPADAPGEMQLGFYESIRAFAREKLVASGGEASALERHRRYHARGARACALDPSLSGSQGDLRYGLEREELRAAYEASLACRPPAVEDALCLSLKLEVEATAIGAFSSLRALLEPPLALARSADVAPAILAGAHIALGRLLHSLGDAEAARGSLGVGLAIARASGDAANRGRALTMLGKLAGMSAQWDEARRLFVEAAEAARDATDLVTLSEALRLAALVEKSLKRFDAASALLDQSLAAATAGRSAVAEATALSNIAETLLERGRLEEALEVARRAADLALASGARRQWVGTQIDLARALHALGRQDEARMEFEKSIAEYETIDDAVHEGGHRGYFGLLLHECGELTRGRAEYEAAIRLLDGSGMRLWAASFRAALGALLADLGEVDEAERLFADTEGVLPRDASTARVAMRLHHAHVLVARREGTAAAEVLRAAEGERDANVQVARRMLSRRLGIAQSEDVAAQLERAAAQVSIGNGGAFVVCDDRLEVRATTDAALPWLADRRRPSELPRALASVVAQRLTTLPDGSVTTMNWRTASGRARLAIARIRDRGEARIALTFSPIASEGADRTRAAGVALQLGARERQLVELVRRGLSNRQIASTLRLTEGTVKVYLHRVFQKVGVESRTQLIALAEAAS